MPRTPVLMWAGALLFTFPLLGAAPPDAVAQAPVTGPPGITVPAVLPPFDPNAPRMHAASGLQRILAFAQDNEREFMQGVGRGLSLAAAERGLHYRVELANNDAARMIEQVQALRAERVGAVVAAPVDAPSLTRSLQELILAGQLCWHGGPAACDLVAECPPIPDRPSPGARGRGLISIPVSAGRLVWCCSRMTACSSWRRASSQCATF
jgi:hypothetical protein